MIDDCHSWEPLTSYYHGIGSGLVSGIDRCQTRNDMFGGSFEEMRTLQNRIVRRLATLEDRRKVLSRLNRSE